MSGRVLYCGRYHDSAKLRHWLSRAGRIQVSLEARAQQLEILEKIVDSLDIIFLHLSRVELYSSMFRINRIEGGVSILHSYILEFVQHAVRFLKKGGLGRLTSALWATI